MSNCGDHSDHSDPRPIESLENSLPPENRTSWGLEDWAWDPQTCEAIPKREMQPEQECSAPQHLTQALPLRQPADLPSGSDAGTAGTASGAANESGESGPTAGQGGASASKVPTTCRPGYCQADECGKNLSKMTFYHVRNKICDIHIKVDVFLRDGIQLRFCQRCGHPHPLDEFDGTKHSCRAQLEKHNARRRKRQAEAAQQKLAAAGGASGKPNNGGGGGGRRQKAAVVVEEDAELSVEGQPSRRSNRKRRAVPIDLDMDKQESNECTILPSRHQTKNNTPSSAAAAPYKPPTARTQDHEDDSPTVSLLQIAGEVLPPGTTAPEAPSSPNFGNIDILPDDLDSWLVAHLSDIEDLGWPQIGSRSPSPAAQNPLELPNLVPNLPETAGSFDFAARLMQLETVVVQQGNTLNTTIEEVGEASGSAAPGPSSSSLASGLKLTKAAMLSTVSVKLFGCTPAELPANLRSQLVFWFDGQIASLEGYMRPGCVHLTVQARIEQHPAAAEEVKEPLNRAENGADHQSTEAEPSRKEPAVDGAPLLSGPKKRREPEGEGAGRALQGSLGTGGVVRLVDKMLASGEPLWRSKTLLVQTGREVALVRSGKLQQMWDVGSGTDARVMPSVLEIKPMVLLAAVLTPPTASCCSGKNNKVPHSPVSHQIIVQGVNLLQDDCEIVCRLQGEYINVENAKCSQCSCSAAVKACCQSSLGAAAGPSSSPSASGWESRCCGCCIAKLASLSLEDTPSNEPDAAAGGAQSCCIESSNTNNSKNSARVDAVMPQLVSLKLNGALRPGVLHIDVLKKAYMAPRGGRVLVVDSSAVHAELLSFGRRAPAAAAAWVEALGIIFEWIGDCNKVNYAVVERTAGRLIHEAIGCGLIEIAKHLHGLMQSALMDAAASLVLPKSKPLGALDALAVLSQIDKASRIATLKRINKLGCIGGLSLLHRAVQSQDPEVVDLVLEWGREAEQPWRSDVPDPRGLTPLHLATLLKNPVSASIVVLTLVASCEPGLAAWTEATSVDGRTPADFAAHLHRTGLLDAFGRNAKATTVCVEHVAVAAGGKEEEVAPSTPRRCKCSGPCPCAFSAEACASCALSSDDEACCGDDGTCSCCANASKPDEQDGDAPCCSGGNNNGHDEQSLPPLRTCCH